MEEKKKNKAELLKEAQDFADKLEEKKAVIETAINALDDKAAKEGVSTEHLSGMAIIEKLFTEYDEIELEQLKVIEQIKKS
jgi:hypothetical protein